MVIYLPTPRWFWPEMVKNSHFGPFWDTFDHFYVGSGPFMAKFGQNWPILAQIGSNLANFDGLAPINGQFWPKFGQI